MRITRIIFVVCTWSISQVCMAGAPAGPSAADAILRQNPQIKTLAGVPGNLKGASVKDCPAGGRPDISRSRCVVAYAPGTTQPHEKNYGVAQSFVLVLHPNSPKVWGVFKKDATKPGKTDLLGEFDMNGHLVSKGGAVAGGKEVNALPTQSPVQRASLYRVTVTPQGWGPIKIGMTVAEASAASGVQLIGGERQGKCSHFHPKTGFEGLSVTVIGGMIVKIHGIETPNLAPSIATGVKFGDQESEALQTYKGFIKAHKYEGGHGDYFDTLVYAPNGMKPSDNIVIFLLNTEEKVSQIVVGSISSTRDEQLGIMSRDGPSPECK